MVLTIENILLVGSLLLLISIVAGKTSYRFGVPTLILFLAVGMLSGSEGLLGIRFDDPTITQFIGVVALNFILFSGGLDTQWSQVKNVLWQGVSLSTFGVVLTALTLGTFVWMITDLTIYESMLLGSIVSSTDAAAVFSILRSKSLSLRKDLRPTLELESGSNDPMAYVLTIAFLTLVINQDMSAWSIVPMFLQQMLLGALLGYLFGRLSKFIINHIRLDFEGLYPVLVIALMFITFSATNFVGGNGFLAIYITAVYLGNQSLMHKRTIMKVYDGLAWLMQIVLFLTLGLLVYPSNIIPIIGVGLLISAFLILVARPISVFISLIPFKMPISRRFYISWVGLRGAVPIVFATYPLIAGVENADMIFNIVFFIAVTSVLMQGTTLAIVAKWLGVADADKSSLSSSSEAFKAEYPTASMREIIIEPYAYAVNKKIVDLSFPPSAIIAMIHRDGNYLTPTGSTIIEPNDILVVLSNNEEGLSKAQACIDIGSSNDAK